MDARPYVGNPSWAAQDELTALFTPAGTQGEADKAISMFKDYTLHGNELMVSMAKTREQNIATHPTMEP